MKTYQKDRTGLEAANKISRLTEPWGDARFPIDVDLLAREAASTFGWNDPITQIYGNAWDEFEGALVYSADTHEWGITYNTQSTPERQRFTKAHELGHYIIHRSDGRRRFQCGSDVMWEQNLGGTQIEKQANQFASCLLMPAKHVAPGIVRQHITFDLLSERAKFYCVSLESMCLKFIELTEQRAVLVKWDNGYMKWCAVSDKARLSGCHIKSWDAPIEPQPNTLAADSTTRQVWAGEMIAASNWYRNEPKGTMLREMKHVSDTHERVLSLLILPTALKPWERNREDE